jgi:hypothetical protein
MLALFRIFQIFLIFVRLSFKADASVGSMSIEITQRQTYQILNDVSKVEEHAKEFNTLL